MDLRKLKTLIDLVAESSISELEITEGEGKVRIVKAAPQAAVAQAAPVAAGPVPVAMPVAPVAAPASAVASEVQDSPPAAPSGHRVSSPMVGTFYRAASPGGAPFVSLGDSVSEGQTLCVIEAMKLMNEIPADRAGVIKEILVENGQAVEFGQPLFVIG